MNSCGGHDNVVVVYESLDCPLCEANKDMDHLQEEADKWECRYDDMQMAWEEACDERDDARAALKDAMAREGL